MSLKPPGIRTLRVQACFFVFGFPARTSGRTAPARLERADAKVDVGAGDDVEGDERAALATTGPPLGSALKVFGVTASFVTSGAICGTARGRARRGRQR